MNSMALRAVAKCIALTCVCFPLACDRSTTKPVPIVKLTWAESIASVGASSIVSEVALLEAEVGNLEHRQWQGAYSAGVFDEDILHLFISTERAAYAYVRNHTGGFVEPGICTVKNVDDALVLDVTPALQDASPLGLFRDPLVHIKVGETSFLIPKGLVHTFFVLLRKGSHSSRLGLCDGELSKSSQVKIVPERFRCLIDFPAISTRVTEILDTEIVLATLNQKAQEQTIRTRVVLDRGSDENVYVGMKFESRQSLLNNVVVTEVTRNSSIAESYLPLKFKESGVIQVGDGFVTPTTIIYW